MNNYLRMMLKPVTILLKPKYTPSYLAVRRYEKELYPKDHLDMVWVWMRSNPVKAQDISTKVEAICHTNNTMLKEQLEELLSSSSDAAECCSEYYSYYKSLPRSKGMISFHGYSDKPFRLNSAHEIYNNSVVNLLGGSQQPACSEKFLINKVLEKTIEIPSLASETLPFVLDYTASDTLSRYDLNKSKSYKYLSKSMFIGTALDIQVQLNSSDKDMDQAWRRVLSNQSHSIPEEFQTKLSSQIEQAEGNFLWKVFSR